MAHEMSIADGELGNRTTECSTVGFLANRPLWISSSGNERRVVLDGQDFMRWIEDGCEKSFQIEPFMRSVFERSVIKVESVHVNVSTHQFAPQKRTGAAEAAPHPRSKRWGELVTFQDSYNSFRNSVQGEIRERWGLREGSRDFRDIWTVAR